MPVLGRFFMGLCLVCMLSACMPDGRPTPPKIYTIEIFESDDFLFEGQSLDEDELRHKIKVIGQASRHPSTGMGHKVRWVIRSPRGSGNHESRRLTNFLATQGFHLVRHESSE